MLQNLRKRSLQKLTERNLNNRDLSQVNEPMRTLGFLVDEAVFQDFEKLQDFALNYGIQPKDVKVFSFLQVKRKLPSMQHNQINNKDFSWSGEINNNNAREFLDKPFDVLVGYYEGRHAFLDLMMASSKARFKVGFEGADVRLFDMIFSLKPRNVEAFREELKKYLKVLNKIK